MKIISFIYTISLLEILIFAIVVCVGDSVCVDQERLGFVADAIRKGVDTSIKAMIAIDVAVSFVFISPSSLVYYIKIMVALARFGRALRGSEPRVFDH